MTPAQCRQARDLLGWTDVQITAQAGIRPSTLLYAEGPHGRLKPGTLAAIRAALEAEGVEFVTENGDEVSVRVRSTPSTGT